MISIENEDGTYDGVYCHFDGYPEKPNGVGATLNDYYLSEDKIRELISKGAMSCLAVEVDNCEFYTKRGEELHYYKAIPLMQLKKKARDVGCEYIYMFYKGEWLYEELFS